MIHLRNPKIIILTRNYDKVYDYLEQNDLMKDVRLIENTLTIMGLTQAKPFNLGVKSAKYDHIIITSQKSSL